MLSWTPALPSHLGVTYGGWQCVSWVNTNMFPLGIGAALPKSNKTTQDRRTTCTNYQQGLPLLPPHLLIWLFAECRRRRFCELKLGCRSTLSLLVTLVVVTRFKSTNKHAKEKSSCAMTLCILANSFSADLDLPRPHGLRLITGAFRVSKSLLHRQFSPWFGASPPRSCEVLPNEKTRWSIRRLNHLPKELRPLGNSHALRLNYDGTVLISPAPQPGLTKSLNFIKSTSSDWHKMQ